MHNIYDDLKKSLERLVPYKIVSVSSLTSQGVASIATPSSLLMLQVDRVKKLACSTHPSEAKADLYEVEYRLAMRYKASCMSDLLELGLSGTRSELNRKTYNENRRSIYVMELFGSAQIAYKSPLDTPLRSVVVTLNGRSNFVLD
jgi:hypothetical protein